MIGLLHFNCFTIYGFKIYYGSINLLILTQILVSLRINVLNFWYASLRFVIYFSWI